MEHTAQIPPVRTGNFIDLTNESDAIVAPATTLRNSMASSADLADDPRTDPSWKPHNAIKEPIKTARRSDRLMLNSGSSLTLRIPKLLVDAVLNMVHVESILAKKKKRPTPDADVSSTTAEKDVASEPEKPEREPSPDNPQVPEQAPMEVDDVDDDMPPPLKLPSKRSRFAYESDALLESQPQPHRPIKRLRLDDATETGCVLFQFKHRKGPERTPHNLFVILKSTDTARAKEIAALINEIDKRDFAIREGAHAKRVYVAYYLLMGMARPNGKSPWKRDDSVPLMMLTNLGRLTEAEVPVVEEYRKRLHGLSRKEDTWETACGDHDNISAIVAQDHIIVAITPVLNEVSAEDPCPTLDKLHNLSELKRKVSEATQ